MRGNKWREEVVGSMWGRGDDGRYIYTSMGSDGVLLSIQGEGVAERLNLFFFWRKRKEIVYIRYVVFVGRKQISRKHLVTFMP